MYQIHIQTKPSHVTASSPKRRNTQENITLKIIYAPSLLADLGHINFHAFPLHLSNSTRGNVSIFLCA